MAKMEAGGPCSSPAAPGAARASPAASSSSRGPPPPGASPRPGELPPAPAAASSAGVAEVNVGGEVFRVSSRTLRKSPFLAALLADDLADDLRDKEGRLFIDRDPTLFAEIVRLLRGYPASHSPQLPWGLVKAEADFYQVPVDLIKPPVQVATPPDILRVRRLYRGEGTTSEPRHEDELCMVSMSDIPADLKSQTRIIAVEVIGQWCGSKTVFLVSQRVLEEAAFVERENGTWERAERLCYHRLTGGVELVVPEHPAEVCRETHPDYVCVTYAVPAVGEVIATSSGVVGILNRHK